MSEYRAFFTIYKGITNELITQVGIHPLYTTDTAFYDVPVEVRALWDTGAVITCIKPTLWERLKLRSLESERTEFAGIGGKVTADATLINLFLSSKFRIEFCPVFGINFPGDADILIGMDIIGMGDFAVCNTDKKTSFSFAMPPFPDRINFADKAETANRDNTVKK